MKTLLKISSAVGLALTVVPAFLVFAGVISWPAHAAMMVVGMVVWFATAPFWMGDNPPSLPFSNSRRSAVPPEP